MLLVCYKYTIQSEARKSWQVYIIQNIKHMKKSYYTHLMYLRGQTFRNNLFFLVYELSGTFQGPY